MFTTLPRLIGGCLVVFVTGCAHWSPSPPLPGGVGAALAAGNVPREALGARVVRLRDGAVLWSYQAERSMSPASTMKLLTSIVALETLKPTWRGRTELVSAGAIDGDTLRGDLVLKGGADPDLDWESVRRMLMALRNKGIARIEGDLVLDRSLFQPTRRDIGLPPFDESPEFRYNVIPDALMLASGLLQFDLEAGADALTVRTTPVLPGVTIDSRLTLADRACAKWEDDWRIPVWRREADGRLVVTLAGSFPRNCRQTQHLAVLDRDDLADRMVRGLWQELGGTLRGVTREGIAPAGAKVLAEHRSRTLAEFNREINKRSDNPITRLVFLVLGTLPGQDTGVTTELRAERVVRGWLASQGIADTGLVLDNGSGLSRKERISPGQLAAVLRAAWKSPWAPEFQASLPIIGIDGAMEKRLADTPAALRGRIKTGSLRDVSAIAGYVPDANGEMCAVVAILNHDRGTSSLNPVGRPVVDAVIEWVAREAGARR